MRTRHSGFRRTVSFVSAAILACSLLAVGHRGMASDCACGNDFGGCCSQTPRLEEFGGWSLFWHDPCRTPTYCWAGEHYSHLAAAPRIYAMVDFLPLFRDGAEGSFNDAAPNAAVQMVSFDDDAEFEPGIRALLDSRSVTGIESNSRISVCTRGRTHAAPRTQQLPQPSVSRRNSTTQN